MKEFFENRELYERHYSEFNADNSIETIKIFDSNNNLVASRYQYYDNKNRPTKFLEKNENENILIRLNYEYSSELLISETHENYIQNDQYKIEYSYDDNGNLISQETKTLPGKLLEFQKLSYNDDNRLIFETGYSVGSFDAIYGVYVNGDKYSFEHEYLPVEGKITPHND